MKNKKMPLYYLGPKSENRPFFKEIIDLIMNDYIFWRRNYHPKDPTVVSYKETQSIENKEFQEKFTDELFKLLAELKIDPPFFSPRYMAHMLSETTLPSLIAYISTMMYNPNNVSSESSPITLKFELLVGQQFAKLFGFNNKETFGHIASGGTLANYESLFYNMGLRFLPISFLLTLKSQNIKNNLGSFEDLLNIPYEGFDQIIKKYKTICDKNGVDFNQYENFTLGQLGLRLFEKKIRELLGKELPEIVVIIPSTGHYSWSRGVKLMGLGKSALVKIPLDKNFQMDTQILEDELLEIKKQNKIVLQLVGVYGTTEFGSFDPIHNLVNIKEKFKQQLYFPIHIDAAYGGYFSTLFHEAPEDVPLNFYQRLKRKHEAIAFCDSITVDPHKLGYTPYGAGGFVFKHGQLKEFMAENAQYCFNPQSTNAPVKTELGKYILEGSKPGASAAAVYFNHKLIPLNYYGHGQILEKVNSTSENFYQYLINDESEDKLVPICTPQSNIICFFIKTPQIKTLSQANLLTKKIATRFGVKKIESIAEYDYIISNTTYNLKNSSEFPLALQDINVDCENLSLVRMVFMNSFHEHKNAHNISYVEDFVSKVKIEIQKAKQNPLNK